MKFKKEYYDKANRVVREDSFNMGGWRSRWERYRDINNEKSNADKIYLICTRPSPKDYLIKAVYGRTADKKFRFKITPVKDDVKRQKNNNNRSGDYCKVHGKKCNYCFRKSRKNYNTK